MDPLRILVVSQYFSPEEFRINEVVESLALKGAKVDVLTGKPNYPDGIVFPGYKAWGCQTEQRKGASVYRVPLFPRGSRSAWRLALNYISFVIFGIFCGSWLLRRRHYDVVFVVGLSPILLAIPAIFFAWRKRLRLALWVQDLWPASLSATGYVRNRIVLKAVESVVRWIYGQSDLILVQSRAFIAEVSKLAPRATIEYYPNSVDGGFAAPPLSGGASADIPALDQGFCVLFAGNVGTAQAVEVIVQAALLLKEYKDIRFVVLGKGSRWDWMQEQRQTLNLHNLYLPGRFPVSTMPSVMQKADALLVTLADEPIFALTVPNKVQAYLAAGRPIIASLNGEGARVVFEAQAGLSVPPQDAEALAAAVLKIYQMPAAERVQLGVNGRRYFQENFDHDRLVEQLLARLQALATR